MFCTNCGNKIDINEKFCTNCGLEGLGINNKNPQTARETAISVKKDEKLYHRLGVVIYVIAHLPLLVIVPVVWSENARYYSSYTKTYSGSDFEAFLYSVLTIIICLLVLRLIKMATKYIVIGIKPKMRDLIFF